MMGAACLALLLGSCVKDDESQSVTNIRDAKTEQLKSVAALNNATAEATKKLAEADAALKLAQAKAAEADAALTAARAKAAEIEAQLKEVELEAARAELEALKAQYAAEIAMYETQKAQYLAQMEQAAVQAQTALLNAKRMLAEAQQRYESVIEGLEKQEAAKMWVLYNEYREAAEALMAAQADLAESKTELAKAETNLVDAEESLEAALAEIDEDIEFWTAEIAYAESHIAIIEKYHNVSVEDAKAAYDAAMLEKNDLYEAYVVATNEYNKLYDENVELDDKMNNTTWNRTGDSFLNSLNNSLPGYYDLSSLYTDIDGDGTKEYCWGYNVESDDELTPNASKFIPLYSRKFIWSDPHKIEYKLEGDAVTGVYQYSILESVCIIDEAAFEGYFEWYAANRDENYAENLENYQKRYDNDVEQEAKWKSVAAAAKVWYDAQQVYDAAYNNAHSYEVYNEETRQWELTAYGTAQDAQRVANNAKNDAENKKAASEAAAEAKKSAEESLKSAKTAQAEADKALAAADKAVADAGKDATDEQKQAAADAKAAAEAAAETVAYWTEQVEETTEKATWAAEDLKEAEAVLKEAEAALKDAEAALKEAEAAVEPARDAAEVAERDYKKAAEAAEVGVYSNAYDAFNIASNNYNNCKKNVETSLARLNSIKENTPENIEEDLNIKKQVLAELLELKTFVDEILAARAEITPELANAQIAMWQATRIYNIKVEEISALAETLSNASSYEEKLQTQKDMIEYAEEQIAELEEQKEEVADFTELEDAIEYWTKIVELDEQYVELCQADADAKKAALEAATATPAE